MQSIFSLIYFKFLGKLHLRKEELFGFQSNKDPPFVDELPGFDSDI